MGELNLYSKIWGPKIGSYDVLFDGVNSPETVFFIHRVNSKSNSKITIVSHVSIIRLGNKANITCLQESLRVKLDGGGVRRLHTIIDLFRPEKKSSVKFSWPLGKEASGPRGRYFPTVPRAIGSSEWPRHRQNTPPCTGHRPAPRDFVRLCFFFRVEEIHAMVISFRKIRGFFDLFWVKICPWFLLG